MYASLISVHWYLCMKWIPVATDCIPRAHTERNLSQSLQCLLQLRSYSSLSQPHCRLLWAWTLPNSGGSSIHQAPQKAPSEDEVLKKKVSVVICFVFLPEKGGSQKCLTSNGARDTGGALSPPGRRGRSVVLPFWQLLHRVDNLMWLHPKLLLNSTVFAWCLKFHNQVLCWC